MKHFVYILTDCNRKVLQVGLTYDLPEAVAFYKHKQQLCYDVNNASRLVYFEEFATEELAVNRFALLAAFTRSQKERLIRAVNKDWLDLSLRYGCDRLHMPRMDYALVRTAS